MRAGHSTSPLPQSSKLQTQWQLCRLRQDLDVMLGAESAVIILDDTEGVWRNHRDNLIQASSNSMLPYKCIFKA